jgi:hypothetical protein
MSGWRAAAVVMIQEGNADSFVTEYRARCLDHPGLTVTDLPVPPPILRRFRVDSTTSFRFRARVEHLLVRIPGGTRTLPEPPAAPAAAGSALIACKTARRGGTKRSALVTSGWCSAS